jgi:natural product precursor
MKSKIKLTDLSHLEPLDEMTHLKGGNDPDEGINNPLCMLCNCGCTCTDPTPSTQTTDATHTECRRTGLASVVVTISYPIYSYMIM